MQKHHMAKENLKNHSEFAGCLFIYDDDFEAWFESRYFNELGSFLKHRPRLIIRQGYTL